MSLRHFNLVSQVFPIYDQYSEDGSTYRREYTPPSWNPGAPPVTGVIGEVVGEPGEVGLGRKPLIVAVAFVDFKEGLLARSSILESRELLTPLFAKPLEGTTISTQDS